MGFKEDLAKERESELETQNRNEYYEGIIKQLPFYKDIRYNQASRGEYNRAVGENSNLDYETIYKDSLLLTLQPECQEVIEDSISFWENWKKLPTLAEKNMLLGI